MKKLAIIKPIASAAMSACASAATFAIASAIALGIGAGAAFATATTQPLPPPPPMSLPLLVVSANDQASGYAGGNMFVRPDARPGSVSVLDLAASPVRSWHIDGVPCSVIGPPACVAVSADGSQILVAAAMQPASVSTPASAPTSASAPAPAGAGASAELRPDSRVTLLRRIADTGTNTSTGTAIDPGTAAAIDPATAAAGWFVAGTVEAGAQASAIALSRDATRAWVSLRAEGAVRVLNLRDGRIEAADKFTFGTGADSLSGIALSPDERTALATLHTKAGLLVLAVAPDGALSEKQRLKLPRGAYHIGFLPCGKRALVGCTLDDVVCLLEERDGAWQLVEKIPTGRTPEGVFVSPDGRWLAVTCFDGANMPHKTNPWFGHPSRVYIYSIKTDVTRSVGPDLVSGRELPVWPPTQARPDARSGPAKSASCVTSIIKTQTLALKNVLQGAAFTADSRTLVVGQFGEGNLRVFTLAGAQWRDTGQSIEIPGQSASLTATKN
jgi:DNA-binding beta-propeller fold protein YncE